MTQPEPLRLADALEKWAKDYASTEDWDAMGVSSADCLRRLYEENQMLLKALQRIDSLRGPFMSEDAVSLCWKLVDNAIAKATGESK